MPRQACIEVRSFGELMQQQLDRNAHKGHWWDGQVAGSTVSPGEANQRSDYYVALLGQKLQQIKVKEGWGFADLGDLVDIANYAMMAADLRHGLVEKEMSGSGVVSELTRLAWQERQEAERLRRQYTGDTYRVAALGDVDRSAPLGDIR